MGDLDRAIFLFFYGGDAHSRAVLLFMIALTVLGSGWSMLVLLPFFAMARARRFAIALTATFLVTAALVQLVKLLVGRARPCVAIDGVHALFGAPTDPSFPSGHAAGAFAFAGFVATVARGRPPVAVAACVVAAGIAASRVYLGCHFPSDILAGALLGAAVGAAGGRLSGVEL